MSSHRWRICLVYGLCLVGFAGCGPGFGSSKSGEKNVSSVLLQLGDSGPEVARVSERLSQIGYFPNATLARQFPMWRPAVAVAPSSPDMFDSNLQEAVKKFQANYGLSQTGAVDETTRQALARERCGDPDTDPFLDPTDKFDVVGAPRWNTTTALYQYVNGTTAQQAAFDSAAQLWGTGNFGFFRDPSGSISVTFCANGSGGCCVQAGFAGNTYVTASGNTITSVQVCIDVNAGSSVMLHELGHAAGLAHSSFTTEVMYPIVPISYRSVGDFAAIEALYPAWSDMQFPGVAVDVGAGGPISGTQHCRPWWAIRNDRGIFYFDGFDFAWHQVSGAAQRIAVDDSSRPWVVAADGSIWRLNAGQSTFTQLPNPPAGGARDIGVSSAANNDAWITGTDNDGAGNGTVYKWSEATQTWTGQGVAAVRGAVSQGVPYFVENSGLIFRWNSGGGYFDSMPGPAMTATDIGAGGSGIVYAAGTDSQGGGNVGAWLWDEQPSASVGSPNPRALAQWVSVAGGIVAVATDSLGEAVVANAQGTVYRQF